MFVFIIPRTPVKLRNDLREALHKITIQSLLNQKGKNWKAIILGGENDVKINNEHFIYIEADDFSKVNKLKIALNYISENMIVKPEYIIRLDADDIISPTYLSDIEALPTKYDVYYDPYHVCVDPVYMKISYSKKNWIANTAIHKYEHAIERCGPNNEILFLQDHDSYWHEYYLNRNSYKSSIYSPLYYRVLTPYSITSNNLSQSEQVNWSKHINYLKGYGPWRALPYAFPFYSDLKIISKIFEGEKPKKTYWHWLFNKLKHYRNISFNVVIQKKNINKLDERPLFSKATSCQMCSRCILTREDTVNMSFDKDGVCNYCRYYDSVTSQLGDANQRTQWITNKIEKIKKEGEGGDYDSILGVSGGVDSSYLAYWAKENGLKPLVVHFDNGWNSELATENIMNICNKLGFALSTYVINWEEFKELQLAYLKAGVIDMEALTDHAIMATISKIAMKYDIKYTLNGFNYATEAIMPKGWVFDKGDWENIKDIYKKFGGGKKIKTFPHIPFYKKLFYHWFLKLESIQVLNYIPYNKQEAKEIITEKLSWRDYGGKHYESIFTKFYQAYILPTRFGVDKRKAHLSNLICSGQITKQEALNEIAKPLYTQNDLRIEKEYVLKKLGLSDQEFDNLMKGAVRKHEHFKTEKNMWARYFKLIRILKLEFK